MRDMLKELDWLEHPVIGYVSLDEKGEPHRPVLGSGWRARRKPITVYQTMANALNFSPVFSAAEVRMFSPKEK